MSEWEVMRRQVALAGQVTDAETGTAVSDAMVQITSAPERFTARVRLQAKQYGARWPNLTQRPDRTTTLSDGSFYFLDLPDGDYTVTAWVHGRIPPYDPSQAAGQVSRGETGLVQIARVQLALPPFTGTVSPPTGTPGLPPPQLQKVFAPTDITGCQLWLNAATLNIGDGDPVAAWADSSGQTHDAGQTAVPRQPVYRAKEFNGRPALYFNGESHFLSLAITESSTRHTFFFVYDNTPGGNHSHYLLDVQSGRLTLNAANASSPYDIRWNDGAWRTIAPAVAGPQLLVWCFSDTTGELFRDGQSLGTAVYMPRSLDGQIVIGANYQGRSSFFAGAIAEIIYYARALSPAERQTVETYLNGRYAMKQ